MIRCFFYNAEFATGSGQEEYREINLKTGNISKNVKYGRQFPLSEKNKDRFNQVWTTIYDAFYQIITDC